MATKVVMEALSPTMEEGRLVEWKKAEGDQVSTGDVLAEVETDKAVMELVARADGTLLKHIVSAGTTVPVASPVAVIGEPGEDISGIAGNGAPEKKPRAAPKPEVPKAKSEPEAPKAESEEEEDSTAKSPAPQHEPVPPAPGAPSGGRIRASPLARRIAAERGVDLATVQGSGPEGRVVKRDLDHVAVGPDRRAAAGTPYEDIPLSPMRKTIAKRLVQSIGPVPTFYLTTEVDMERAAEARDALKAAAPDGAISFNDIILKATALALKEHPACNAWWQDNHIRQWHEVHLGMAVAVEEGLITPVIRFAARKSLREINAEARDLATRGRERRLKPEEYTGSTFSVSNLGMFGIDEFTAIINPPEAGILAIGRIEPRAVVVDGRTEVRRRMRLTMSCDHRVIDGATGARFLQTLRLLLENPLAMVW